MTYDIKFSHVMPALLRITGACIRTSTHYSQLHDLTLLYSTPFCKLIFEVPTRFRQAIS